jgi:quercetin dioxygenase-like cupin family protein
MRLFMSELSIIKRNKVIVTRPGLKVVHFYLAPGDIIPEHKTNADVVVTTVRGKGVFTINLVSYEMTSGVVLEMIPYTPHSIEAIEELEFIVVHMHLAQKATDVHCNATLQEKD